MSATTGSRSTAAYRRIAAELRGRILGGEWAPNTQLPTEQALCEQLGVSRITIRQAMRMLSEERLLHRRQGSGTFVSPRPARRIPLLQAGFNQSVSRHAPELRRRVLAFGRRRATPAVADELELRPGSRIIYARRVDLLNDRPVAYDDVYLPESYGDRLGRHDLEEVRFSAHWIGIQQIAVIALRQRVEAVAANASQAKLLRVPRGTALLMTHEVLVEQHGEAAGLFVTHYHGQTFSLATTCQYTKPSEGD